MERVRFRAVQLWKSRDALPPQADHSAVMRRREV